MLLLLSGCCSYCAEITGQEVIEITLIDKNTGNEVLSNQQFTLISEVDNPSKLSGGLDLSLAKKKGMKDRLTLIMRTGCNCTIADLAVEYVLYGDRDCCDLRSVKVKNIRNYCADPNVELITTGGIVAEIKIMVEI